MTKWYHDGGNGASTPPDDHTTPSVQPPVPTPVPTSSVEEPWTPPTPAPTPSAEEPWTAPTPAPTPSAEEPWTAPTPVPTPSADEPWTAPTPAPTPSAEEPWTAPTPAPTPSAEEPWTPPTPPAPPTYPSNSYYGVPRSPYGVPPTPPEPPKKKKVSAAVVVLSVVCALSLVVSCVLGVALLADNDSDKGREDPGYADSSDNNHDDDVVINENGPTLQISDAQDVNDGGLSTSEIVARNLDATVVLTMYQQSASIHEFYGYSFGSSSELVKASEASGIIMSEDGYIITNSHCVFDEESQREYARIDVTLYDGTVYESVDIIGYDPTTDLAVIKIDAKNLHVAEFGDSAALALGDRVVTLGNSGGLQWSVSQGVLSGQARDVYEDTGYAIKCLQVDAVINPGSSGGPLLNAYGQVVGVNSAKIVLTGYEGLGFSIPINEAKAVIDDLIKYGYVTGRVALGITGRTITSVGYEGFMIDEIANGSAFEGTQVRAGDIITHVEGERVMDYAEMRAMLTSYDVGDKISLTLIRLNQQTRQVQEFTVQVTLKESK